MHHQTEALSRRRPQIMTNGSSQIAARAGIVLAAALALGAGTVCAAPGGRKASHAPKAAPTKAVAEELTPLDVARLGEEMHKAKGRDLFIHLWASWCGPCLEELPEVDRFAREARARGATFLSVSLDDPKRAAHVLDVLHRRAPNLTPFVARFDDPDKFIALFSSEWEGAIPALFSYDRQGRLRGSVIGEIENAEIRRMLADISIAPPEPPPAQSP
jgi:thiol-disulfide isomerase/thioredoxin